MPESKIISPQAHFKQKLYSFDTHHEISTPIPEWADFLIKLGWHMRDLQIPDYQIICTALLPTRICSASFCALGSLASRLHESGEKLTWDDFIKLPLGTEVFGLFETIDHKKKKNSKIKAITKDVVEGTKTIQITESIKKLKGSLIHVFPPSFVDLEISLSEHPSSQKKKYLHKLSKFFEEIIYNFNKSSLLKETPETLVVTNKSRFARECENISICYKENINDIQLSELLMMKDERTVILHSNSEKLDEIEANLGILDGAEALSFFSSIPTKNKIILLNRTEFQERKTFNEILMDISEGSIEKNEIDEKSIDLLHKFLGTSPSGIETSLSILGI